MTVFSCVFFWTYSVSSFGFIEVAVIRRTHVILMYEYTVYSRNRWSVPLFVIFRASWRTLRIACNTMLLLLLFCGRITVTTLDEVSASVWLLTATPNLNQPFWITRIECIQKTILREAKIFCYTTRIFLEGLSFPLCLVVPLWVITVVHCTHVMVTIIVWCLSVFCSLFKAAKAERISSIPCKFTLLISIAVCWTRYSPTQLLRFMRSFFSWQHG